MKDNTAKKSSFTIPAIEANRIRILKKQLKLRSNTDVLRMALRELEERLAKERLREEFARDSKIVAKINCKDMQELDDLAGEGLDES